MLLFTLFWGVVFVASEVVCWHTSEAWLVELTEVFWMSCLVHHHILDPSNFISPRWLSLVEHSRANASLVYCINPLPDMPILGSSNSAASKDLMSKIWTNGDIIIWLSRKHCGKRRNCSLRAISSFPPMFSKTVCRWWVKTSIYGVKG